MIKPKGALVWIEREAAPEKIGLMYVPDTAKDARREIQVGVVMGVGPDCKCAKVGERVAFAKYISIDLEIEGTMYTFIKDGDIVCEVTDEN